MARSCLRPLALGAMLALSLSGRPAAAQFTAITLPTGTVGNQGFTGPLGIDFDVTAPITITAFGAFDSGNDGFAAGKTVRLYDRSTQTQVGGVGLLPGSFGNVVGAFRFFPLIVPVLLPAGFQGTIVGEGFGADLNYNTGGAPFPGTIDTGGGLIAFVGGSRFGFSPGSFPTSLDGGPAVRSGAGSFQFTATATVPEPATVALLAGGLVAVAGIARRRARS